MQYLKGKVLRATDFKSLFSGTKRWKKLILSSYCIDHEWLLWELPAHDDLVLIQHGSEAVIKKGRFNGKEMTLLTPPFPQFPKYGVMHCKLMLMLGEEFLRIVVSSGNLMEFDYNGQVANVLFIQDLPKLRSQSASSVDSLLNGQFYRSLSALLDELGCFRHPGVVLDTKELEEYDWRVIDPRIKLVYSIPGYFDVACSNGQRRKSGLLMLTELVKEMQVPFDQEITLEYQGSSLGAITKDWLDSFGKAAVGALPIIHKRSTESLVDAPPVNFKVVFPSLETVQKSAPGPPAFGTIFSKIKDFRAPGCPREVFHDCRSGTGMISEYPMHSKIMTVSIVDTKSPSKSDDSKEIIILDSDEEAEVHSSRVLYRLLGSHNFTAAAWGRFLKDGTKLMINNYEVGVLLPGDFDSGHFPYTYHRPAQKYSSDDEPWDQTAYFNE